MHYWTQATADQRVDAIESFLCSVFLQCNGSNSVSVCGTLRVIVRVQSDRGNPVQIYSRLRHFFFSLVQNRLETARVWV